MAIERIEIAKQALINFAQNCGKRSFCKRGQWADNDEVNSEDNQTEIRKPSVDWMELQVNGIDANEISPKQ